MTFWPTSSDFGPSGIQIAPCFACDDGNEWPDPSDQAGSGHSEALSQDFHFHRAVC